MSDKISPQFVSMAELSCSRLLQVLFDNCKGSKDRLMDILKLGAPAMDYGKCKGRHHPACTEKYGCIGERRLLLPGKFAVWLGECEKELGVEVGEQDGAYRLNIKKASPKLN